MSISDLYSSLVSNSGLSVPYINYRPIIIDVPYPALKAALQDGQGVPMMKTGRQYHHSE